MSPPPREMVRAVAQGTLRAEMESRRAEARAEQTSMHMPPGWDGGKGQEAGPPGMGLPTHLVHQPGGDTLNRLLVPGFEVFEEMYQVLPEESWYDPTVSPSQPIQFELGAFQVPAGMHLWVFDYTFTPFRLSGVDAGDIVPVEDQRLTTVLGFDLTISGRRTSHLLYQLDPVKVQLQQQPNYANIRPAANPGAFDRAQAQSFASAASPATSLLPSRHKRQGAESGPFTIIARENERVALSCVIFRTVPFPLGSIQGRHAGYLVASNVSESILNRMRPR